jgi:FtsH-binding integral membrane protein
MSYNYNNNPYNQGQPDPYNQQQQGQPNPYGQQQQYGYNQGVAYDPYTGTQVQSRVQSVMSQVYMWMTGGVLVTGAVSVLAAQTGLIYQIGMPGLIVCFLLQLGLVIAISAGIRRMAPMTATALFLLYSALMGVTMSFIFLVYTKESIASTFFIAGGMFALMSLYGYTTKQDLSKIGNILLMALIGLIIASIVNIFLASSGLYWLITYAGVLIFVGLTAWDTQKIKKWIEQTHPGDGLSLRRIAILGALELYLDFINLFLFLLRIFGSRRN